MIAGALNRNSALIKLDKETGSTIFSETYNNGGTDAFGFAHSINVCTKIVKSNLIEKIESNLITVDAK